MAEKTSKEHEHKARATYDRLCGLSGVSTSWRIAIERKTDIAAAVERLQQAHRRILRVFLLPANAVRERAGNEKPLERPAGANLDADQGSGDAPPAKS